MTKGQTARDPLLTTKVHIPQPVAPEVERCRLLRSVDGVLEPGRAMLLISAPAGFGKSTLISRWVAGTRGATFSWLTLDPDDNDPVRFWSYFAFSVRQAHPAFGDRADQALHAVPVQPNRGAWTGRQAVTLLLNDLAALPGLHVIVLDDFHHVSSAAVLTEVAYALEHWPANTRLLVSTRVDPPLPISRLRAAGRLTEIRASHLRFTPEESAEFLRSSVQLPLEPDQVHVIDRRAEGWIAGLKMTALALGGASDARPVVQNLAENPHLILDYLAEEVLDRQEKRVQEFLIQTAVLDRFCAPLCDAVTGREDSGDMVREVQKRNLFLVPLDDFARWFRYHPLFGDLLRARLGRNHPGLPAVLHRRASHWFDASGLPDEAVHHARVAGDVEQAVDLVVRHSRRLIWDGWSATVLRWLDGIPEEAVQKDLRLIVSRCWVSFFTDRWQAMDDDLSRAEALLGGTNPPWGGAVVTEGLGRLIRHNSRITVAILRAFAAYRQGDPVSARDLARRAIPGAESGSADLLGAALTIHAYALRELGSLEEAQAALLRSSALFLAQQNVIAWATCVQEHVDILLARGLLGEARRVSAEALELLRARGGLGLPAAGRLFIAAAEAAWLRNDMKEASASWSAAAASGEPAADPVVVGYCLLGRARLAAAEGKAQEALDLLGPAVDAARSHGSKSLLHQVTALRALLWARTGQVRELQREADAAAGAVARVRCLAGGGHHDAARQLARKSAEEARSAGLMGIVPALLALEARAAWEQGEKELALTVLRQALELAAPEQALRVFLDESDGLREPLEELMVRFGATGAAPGSRAAVVLQSLHLLLSALGPRVRGVSPNGPASAASPGVRGGAPVETLTPKEREVLRLLAAGLSNQQIADRLFVSMATVKKHVSAVLEKLGAANRTRAVALGRVHGLL